MRRLLTYFDRVFDPDFRVDGNRLGDLVTRVLDEADAHVMPEFGTEGDSGKVASKTDGFVRFFYRPHLFSGMDAGLRLAHQLQFHLLPRELPEGAPVEVAAVLESYCHLSGDLFGWERLRDGRFLIWIADMAGHGVRSGLCATVLRILIGRARERCRVAELAEELNRSLHDCLRDRFSGIFATGFFLALDPSGSATYGSAGHPPILLRRSGGAIEELLPTGKPLGLLRESEYRSGELTLAPGDALLLYSDGLVETKTRQGEEFGLDRVRGLFAKGFGAPEEMTASIYHEISIRQDLRRLDDDVTFLVARHG